MTETEADISSIKKGVFKDFSKFTGKPLCQSLFLLKLQGSATVSAEKIFLEKLLEIGIFPWILATSKTPY